MQNVPQGVLHGERRHRVEEDIEDGKAEAEHAGGKGEHQADKVMQPERANGDKGHEVQPRREDGDGGDAQPEQPAALLPAHHQKQRDKDLVKEIQLPDEDHTIDVHFTFAPAM